jgi:hypothetical protein
MAETYYDVLDLDRDASPEEIKAAFRKLARDCHPDIAGDDPQAAERFRNLNEAYQVLSDPQQKRDYDRRLPQKSYPLRHPTPEKVWREATDVVLLRSDRFGPLNQAMKAGVPLLIDGEAVILAMQVHERHLAGHLETASNRNAILNALEMVVGRRMDFRIVDVTSAEEYQKQKEAEARLRKARTAPPADKPPAAAAASKAGTGREWDDLIHRIHHAYQELPRRQFPQSKARFLREALKWIREVEEELRYSQDFDEESHERGFARALERLGTVADLNPVQVALEYERLKREG